MFLEVMPAPGGDGPGPAQIRSGFTRWVWSARNRPHHGVAFPSAYSGNAVCWKKVTMLSSGGPNHSTKKSRNPSDR